MTMAGNAAGVAAPYAATRLTLAALVVAAVGVAGSLWLSLGMELKACPLCLYQRAFLMAAAGVLLIGLLTPARATPLPALLALPSAVAGLAVAAFHVCLEWQGTLECPTGIAGWGTAPQQSLALFVVLIVVLVLCIVRGRSIAAAAASALLGIAFAAGAVASAPPMPGPPSAPYAEPITVCRPPFAPT